MPITRFIQEDSFDPEQIKSMSWALDEICNELHVCDDASRQVLAVRIIELAQCGMLNGRALRNRVLREAAAPSNGDEAPLVPRRSTP